MAIFPNESAADQAAAELKGWEKANEDMTPVNYSLPEEGAIGVLAKDNQGKIKEHKLGSHETGVGAGIGVVLGIIATVMTGGLALIGGIAGGMIIGGLVGSFVHHGLGISEEELRLLNEKLESGQAAVGVLVPENEAAAATTELKRLGGDITAYQVSDEALQHCADAAKSAGARGA